MKGDAGNKIALEGTDLHGRGWAVVCLGRIGGADATAALTRLHDDAEQSMLVRTWAIAARVRAAKTRHDLVALSQQVGRFPGAERPLIERFLSDLDATPGAGRLAQMIELTLTVPGLQQQLAPQITAADPATLAEVMLSANHQTVRRQAAAYAGAALQRSPGAVTAFVEAYRFDPEAEQLPWHGGALYVPGITWTQESARQLVGYLIRWHLYCERHEDHGGQNQIHNNLRSVGLSRVAGYCSPGNQIDAYLLAWGRVIGAADLDSLLAEQGVEDQPRYRRILEKL